MNKWLTCKVKDRGGYVYTVEGRFKSGYWRIRTKTGKVIDTAITKAVAVKRVRGYSSKPLVA